MPGRPRASELEARNQRLLDVATEIFLDVGFAQATMEAIAKKAEASMVTLYSRYPTKGDLFTALVERKASALFLSVGPPDRTLPVRRALIEFSTAILALHAKPDTRRLYRLVIAESLAFPDLARSFWRGGPGQGLAAVTRYFEHAASIGHIESASVHRAAETFMSLLVGGSIMRTTLGLPAVVSTSKERREWAVHAVHVLLGTADCRIADDGTDAGTAND